MGHIYTKILIVGQLEKSNNSNPESNSENKMLYIKFPTYYQYIDAIDLDIYSLIQYYNTERRNILSSIYLEISSDDYENIDFMSIHDLYKKGRTKAVAIEAEKNIITGAIKNTKIIKTEVIPNNQSIYFI